MDVYWLEQTQSDIPAGEGWLSAAEVLRLDSMRFPKRRADWRLGRWTAKCALAAYLKRKGYLRDIELRPTPCGAPEAYLGDRPAPVSISLSHCCGTAVCAIAPARSALGCDLEFIEPHSESLLADYFTPEEQALVARAPSAQQIRLVALLWSAKESALKALRAGLRLDTRSVIATPADSLAAPPGSWRRLQVRCTGGRVFHGWWEQTDGLVRTLVADPPALVPIALDIAVDRPKPAESWPAGQNISQSSTTLS